MKNISLFITDEKFKSRTKDTMRTVGWDNLKVGDVLMACVNCQNLKKGQKIVKLGPIRIKHIAKQPLYQITISDCIREGFPELSPHQFIEMFCYFNECTPYDLVNRMEFEYLNEAKENYLQLDLLAAN